jgi:hypothetical protein
MDPVTLAVTATSLFVPYVEQMAGKTAEKIGEQLPATVGKVWTAIRTKFAGKPAAEEAILDVTAKPENPLFQSALTNQLCKVLEADPTFAAEFERLLAEAQTDSSRTIINIGSGAIATEEGVAAGKGGFANRGNIYGNVTVGRKDSEE